MRRIVFFANSDWYLYNFRAFQIKSLVSLGFEVHLFSPSGPYVSRLEALGVSFHDFQIDRRGINPFAEARRLVRLARMLRRLRPSLLHSFTLKCSIYGSIAARAVGLDAFVSSIAGLGYVFTSSDYLARVLRPIVSLLLKFSLAAKGSRIIVQNSDDLSGVSALGVLLARKVRLVRGSGVDCDRFNPGSRSVRSGKLRVLFPARLLWDKGIGEFIEAARILKAAGCDMHFLVAGDCDSGNPSCVPEHIVSQWTSDGDVEFLGHVEDMAELYRSVDVAVLPSYREGLPKSLIEAGACGCAIVTTDVPGCREVVSDYVSGRLVPVRDVQAIVNVLRQFELDRDLVVSLGEQARKSVIAEFSDQVVRDGTFAVYRELLSDV